MKDNPEPVASSPGGDEQGRLKLEKVLVVGPSWVGDMVMAQSLFKTIKQQHPNWLIDVLAPAWSKPLLTRMPEVNDMIEMPLGHGRLELAERWRLGKSLKGVYQQAILLPNSWKSAVLPFAAGIKKRTGFVGEFRYGLLNDARKLNKKKLTMTVQRFVALAGDSEQLPEVIAPQLEVKVSDVFVALKVLGLAKKATQKLLVLCPGAEFGAAKRWPEEKYAELAREYLAQGWAVWLFGSDKDKTVCKKINDLTNARCQDLSSKTTLAQAVDLISLADAVVSNDSGLMHVAAALNRPLVAIYGSSDPHFTPPLNKRHSIVSLGLSCSPCFKRECPLGHLDCLNLLPVNQVVDALESL